MKRYIYSIVLFFSAIYMSSTFIKDANGYIYFLFNNADNIITGTLPNARLDQSSVTLRGQLNNGTQSIFVSSFASRGTISSTAGFVGNGDRLTFTKFVLTSSIEASSMNLTSQSTNTIAGAIEIQNSNDVRILGNGRLLFTQGAYTQIKEGGGTGLEIWGADANPVQVRNAALVIGDVVEGDWTDGSFVILNGSATFLGDSSALRIVGTTFSIGGINYNFPRTEGANGKPLTTNGSGILTWNQVMTMTSATFRGNVTSTSTLQGFDLIASSKIQIGQQNYNYITSNNDDEIRIISAKDNTSEVVFQAGYSNATSHGRIKVVSEGLVPDTDDTMTLGILGTRFNGLRMGTGNSIFQGSVA